MLSYVSEVVIPYPLFISTHLYVFFISSIIIHIICLDIIYSRNFTFVRNNVYGNCYTLNAFDNGMEPLSTNYAGPVMGKQSL